MEYKIQRNEHSFFLLLLLPCGDNLVENLSGESHLAVKTVPSGNNDVFRKRRDSEMFSSP